MFSLLHLHHRLFSRSQYKYGIYVDCYTANMLMDVFVKEGDYAKAALAAHEVMLQEMDTNELTLAACLLSCVQCSRQSLDGYAQQEEQEAAGAQKLLVYFKRKQWHDGHFDLASVRQLNGKTIWWAAMQLKSAPACLVSSLQIYGLLLWGKLDEAVALFEQVLLKDRGQLYAFLVSCGRVGRGLCEGG